MSGAIKQIICIKWGTKFGPDYVNRLRGMIARNITPPFRLVCFSEQAQQEKRLASRDGSDPDCLAALLERAERGPGLADREILPDARDDLVQHRHCGTTSLSANPPGRPATHTTSTWGEW